MRLRQAFLSLVSGNVLVTAANLLRDISLAATFGAALDSDVLFLAISIPVFILTVGSNGFRSVVVPALSRIRTRSAAQFREASTRFVRIASSATGVVAAVLLVIAAASYFVAVPGIPAESRRLFALFLLAIVPMYAGNALVELLQGPLQVTGRFLLPSLLRLGLPLGIIIGVLALPDLSIFAAAIGGAAGVLLLLPVGAWLLRQDHMLPTSRTVPLPADVGATALAGYKAIVAATMITYANPLVDQWIAGFAGPGATSHLGYANRLMTGVVGLVAGALSQVLLIQFSNQVGTGDRAGLSATYRLLTRVMPWVGCAATLAVWLTSRFLVTILYQRGSFDAADAAMVADLVNRYALQFPVFWTGIAGGVLVWALSMNHILVRIGIVLFTANVLGDLLFVYLFGVRGIPLSTTLVLLISVVLVNASVHRTNQLDIRLADWAHAVVPLSLLALSGLLISRFDLGLAPVPDLAGAVGAFLLFSAFAGCGLAFSLGELRRYRARLTVF